LGLPRFWSPITLCADLWLRWDLKQIYSPLWELSNGMWQTTCMKENQGNSRRLMVRSQIDNLTRSPSFGHNLCFKYSNGSCKLILNIYVLRAFQRYNEPFNPMGFDLWNRFLKIWDSIKTPTPKVGIHLGVWRFIPSHPPTLRKYEMRLPSFIFGLHLCKSLFWS